MVQGLGHTFSERTFQRIRSSPFSINLDESTSNSNKKVLSILVSYFNQELNRVVVEHLGSIEVIKGTAYHLETALVTFFKDHQIPFSNMVSMMLDSCNVMRGSKSGLETRIRDKHCQTLLDIDGDSCHHIHNAAKREKRKERVVKKVWFESLNTNLHLSVYLGVLPILKEYVMVFQGSQTLVHKLHDKQFEVVTSFMACFIKAEHLHTTPKKLVEMEFSDKMLPLRELYVGPLAEKLKTEHPQHLIVLQFLNTVKTAYISTAAYMQKKLPLNSRTLQALSALDPLVRGHSETGILLKRLSGPEMMGHLVPPQCDVPLEVV
ncbi:Zinc finger BED domain containing protein 5 [Dissostichus eleginoides]|uniref:Zinc finger BED domain containing protein 5 n=1 Tax=Dissostichus eleginoides TaxID=100907 RepID=A0AAD9CHZ7_DISEL|nr:Zinc finger BED domain containing protein 5 [Dissostichus eleginoides]